MLFNLALLDQEELNELFVKYAQDLIAGWGHRSLPKELLEKQADLESIHLELSLRKRKRNT